MTIVAHALPDDASGLAELFREMDKFYGEAAEESVEAKTKNINLALFSDRPCVYAVVARERGTIAGFASYSFLWPAVMSTKSLFLKELYVRQAFRHSGIGRLLMAYVFNIAQESHCTRVEWTTDSDNRDAQEFYDRLGFPNRPSKLFYRAEHDDLQKFDFDAL